MQKEALLKGAPVPKRKIKDSVFCDLFSDSAYLLELYRTLHPEDGDAVEDDLETLTLDPVLVDDIYNDLGFMARGHLMILVEAQSTWSVNILIRILLYLAHTYQKYIHEHELDVYAAKKLELPRPELYVVYVGKKKVPDTITLSKDFFGTKSSAIEITAKVISSDEGRDIISQYIAFSRIVNEQVKIYGRTVEALRAAIEICREKDILTAYLAQKEDEVITMMMDLFDEEEIMKNFMKNYGKSCANDAKREMILGMYHENLPADQIARIAHENISYVESVISESADKVAMA